MSYFLGFDTSNYTTSVALCDESGMPVGKRRLLPVAAGQRGLRQSDALFSHVKALPELVRELTGCYAHRPVAAVGVSAFPRRVEGSYMPCFLAGVSVAASVAAFFDVPLFEFSHQEGHVEAAKLGSGFGGETDYLAFHLSGGTLELLQIREEKNGLKAHILADSADITAGQLIDRCGVKLGLLFPCGKELEQLALLSQAHFPVKIPQTEGKVNLSGLENRFERLLSRGNTKEDCARFVFDCVIAACRQMLSPYPDQPVLFMGGVSSSVIVKEAFAHRKNTWFSSAETGCDNALGIAALTRKKFLYQEE